MSRNLKRVPLDFDWPMNDVWKGYINPFNCEQCKSCDETGLNPETKKLSDDWYTHNRTDGKEGWGYNLNQKDVQALIDADRLRDFTRVPRTPEQLKVAKKKIADGGNSWLPESNGYIPTAAEVNIWGRNGFGHDSINHSICVRARAKRIGIYGHCKYCDGEGVIFQSKEIEKLHNEWESFEPPAGEGYQMWEDCSEGSPISPVLETPEELAQWLADTGASAFGGQTATYKEWLATIEAGYALGMIVTTNSDNQCTSIKTGVAANLKEVK